jgi:hypothetical protein
MKYNRFLNDIEIEQALLNYCDEFGLHPLDLFCLTDYNLKIDLRIMGLIRDIRINLIFCYIEYCEAQNIRLKMGDEKHIGKNALSYQHHLSNFVFRFRALGDKLMRLLVLLFCTVNEFKKYDSSKSRIGIFLGFCDENEQVRRFSEMAKVFRMFDEQYRTDEAHGMGGCLRKSIVTDEPIGINDPIMQIGNYWNLFVVNQCGAFHDISQLTLDASRM